MSNSIDLTTELNRIKTIYVAMKMHRSLNIASLASTGKVLEFDYQQLITKLNSMVYFQELMGIWQSEAAFEDGSALEPYLASGSGDVDSIELVSRGETTLRIEPKVFGGGREFKNLDHAVSAMNGNAGRILDALSGATTEAYNLTWSLKK